VKFVKKVVTLPSLFFSSNLLKTLNINMGKVSKIKVKDLKQSIVQSVKEIGGFAKYVKKGDVVLVKPNFNTADPFPASTDMEFLKIVVDLIYSNGAKQVIIGDSCTLTQNTCRVMKEKGVFDLEDKTKILVFEKHGWVKKEIPGGKYLKKVTVPEILDKVDKLILLPCIKTHYLATFTGSIKLSVGFMKPIERIPLHARRLEEKIAEMNLVIKPDLIIMDARKCFINKGPDKGEIREPNYILASTDRLAIDIEGVKIIQEFKGNDLERIKPEEIAQIKRFKEII